MNLTRLEKRRLLIGFSSVLFQLSLILFLTLLLVNGFNLSISISFPAILGVTMVLMILMLFSNVWLISVIRRDKSFLIIDIDELSKPVPFEELSPLRECYKEKLDKINLLKRNFEEENHTSNEVYQDLKKNQLILRTTNSEYKIKEDRMSKLSDGFSKISNSLPSHVWLTDYQGNLIFLNESVKQKIDLPILNDNLEIYDLLDISSIQFDLFRRRNFQSIDMHFKNNNVTNGKNARIFYDESIKRILFIAAISNQDNLMNKTYLKKSRDLHFVNEISKIISGQNSIETTLQDAIDRIAFLGNYNSCSIRLVNDNNELEIKALGGYSHEFVMKNKKNPTNSHLGFSFKNNRIVILNDISQMLFEEADIENVLNHNKRVLYIPLTNYNKTLGVLAIVSDNKFDEDSIQLLESISINVTIALEKILLYDRLKSNYFKTVEAFVTATDIKSDRFNGHSRRVADICKLIAEKLYLSPNEVDEIYMAGLLHDVGKLAFSDHSLDYYYDIDNHGSIGRRMVEKVGLTKDILEGIEFHHINYDLSNCKIDGLNEQPYYAQIIRIANDFDLYMNYESTEPNAPMFIKENQHLAGTVYSSQFLRIMNDIIENHSDELSRIYSSEGQYEA